MDQPFYNFSILDKACRFNFFSKGKVVIPKPVIFLQTNTPNLFSLTLADIYEDGSFDFTSVSDNDDLEKDFSYRFSNYCYFS